MWWSEYGVDWFDAIRIVASSIAFYLVVLALIRLIGQRALISLSSFDLASIIALGALIGRAILGDSPTLIGGILGVITLLIMQAVTGQIRRFHRAEAIISNPALVLMAGAEFVAENLAHAHIEPGELRAKLRAAGIRRRDEVACVILESTGQMSILRRGALIESEMLAGVRGAERIPAELREN